MLSSFRAAVARAARRLYRAPPSFQTWARARLVLDGCALTPAIELFADYQAFMVERGGAPWPYADFKRSLADHGVRVTAITVDGLRRFGARLKSGALADGRMVRVGAPRASCRATPTSARFLA